MQPSCNKYKDAGIFIRQNALMKAAGQKQYFLVIDGFYVIKSNNIRVNDKI